MGKRQSGTISKVTSGNFQTKLSKKDLEELRSAIYKLADEIKEPSERYTRHTSELIKSMRDKAETLILNGGEPGLTQKDTASYVWKILKERNIAYPKPHFYKYFSAEQKRDWQSQDFLEKENPDHKHIFEHIGHLQGIGNVEKCGGYGANTCPMLRINGRLHQALPDEPPEPELKPTKQNPQLDEKFLPLIQAFQESGDNLHDFAGVLKQNAQYLTDDNLAKLKCEIFLMKQAGEFCKMAMDKKHLIHPFTQHLLATAYAEETQKYAGGLFIMYRLDLATRKHGDGVKGFKTKAEFSKLLSTKQTGKAMAGKVRELNERYEPHNEWEAMDMGFSGQQCSDCGRWRVGYDTIPNPNWKEGDPAHEKSNVHLVCFACGETYTDKRKHFPLPKTKPVVCVDLAAR